MTRYINILLFIFFSLNLNSQLTYYVSGLGNDQNSGSIEMPWASIQYGIDNIEAGDSLFIRDGIYEENLIVSHSGTKLNPLYISSFKGEKVKISGKINNEKIPVISLEKVKYIVLQGFEIGNEPDESSDAVVGIEINTSENIQVSGCKIYGNSIGVHIINAEIQNHLGTIQLKNNFIFRNSAPGIVIGPLDPNENSGVIINVKVRNNSLFENDMSESGRGEIQLSYCHESEIRNNILNMGSQPLAVSVYEYFYNLNFDYNAFYSVLGKDSISFLWNGQKISGFDNYRQVTNSDVNGMVANPFFLNVSEELVDLHLTPNSPMINSGDPTVDFDTNETDIDGQLRLNGEPDIGADEYYLNLIICSLGIFKANVADNKVELNWTGTCFSESGGRYLVQRSRDSEEWETIGTVLSQLEQLNTEVYYTYFDEFPMEGISYYRVQFIDDNGSFNNSNPDVVEFASLPFLVFPNPVPNILNIILGDKFSNQDVRLRIYSSEGKLLKEKDLTNNEIDISSFPAGILYLELEQKSGTNKFMQKLIHSK